MSTVIKQWSDVFFKVGTPLALAAMLWLGSTFATKEELRELDKRVNDVETVLRVMVEQNKVNERQNEELADHEQRIRKLERGS